MITPTEDLEGVQLSEEELAAGICRDSFFQFVKEFWGVIIKDAPVWNWHIEFLCHELQQVAERVFTNTPKAYDLIINVPPGSSKSTIASIMFPAWVWTRKASLRTIGASHADLLARDLARKGRLVVESEKYRRYFPEVQLRRDQNAKGFYETTEGGDRVSIGVDGNIIGRHGHFIIIDDPINPKAARSDKELETTNTWMKETINTRKVDKAVSVVILIMQRLHENDPAALMEKELASPESPVRVLKIPCDTSWDIQPPRLKRRYCPKTGLMDPVRMSRPVLKGMEKILGDYGYAGQFGQSPVPKGGGMFKIDRIKPDAMPRDYLGRFKQIIRYWDKAGTGGGGCFTVGLLLGLDIDGVWWILDVVRGQWEAAERERIILETAKADGAQWGKLRVQIGIEQEGGSGGKESAQGTIGRLAGFRVVADIPRGDKTLRADPVATQVNGGNFKYIAGAGWWPELRNEMKNFPNSTYKDQIDALSGAFALGTTKRKAGAAW